MPSRFRQGTARILHVHQCAALFCAMLALVHCSRHSVPPPVAQDPDSGVVAVPCDPAPKYSVSAGPPASVSPVQATGWSITSSGGSCAGLQPRAIGPMLQWSSPSTDYYVCDAPEIDGDGTVAIHTPVLEVAHEEGPAAVALLSTDGSSRSIINSNTVRSVQPRSSSGFWLLDNHCWGKETRNRVALDGGLQESTPSEDSRMFPNPQGGFVEARTAADFLSTEVRWLDDHLVATSPWHSVKTWPPGNRTEKLALDKLGRVLFLTFHFPSTFGAPPPPSDWTFSAQWIGPEGLLGPEFLPPVPMYLSGRTPVWPAGWGELVALADGGLAAYHSPAASISAREQPGTGLQAGTSLDVQPSGWYAVFRPPDSKLSNAVPAWMPRYESLRLSADGRFYMAVQRDGANCQRTASIVSSVGDVCATVPLVDSASCSAKATFSGTGTLLLTEYGLSCGLRWWPALFSVP